MQAPHSFLYVFCQIFNHKQISKLYQAWTLCPFIAQSRLNIAEVLLLGR